MPKTGGSAPLGQVNPMTRTATTSLRPSLVLRTVAKRIRNAVQKHTTQRGVIEGFNAINSLRDRYIDDQSRSVATVPPRVPHIGIVRLGAGMQTIPAPDWDTTIGLLSAIDVDSGVDGAIAAADIDYLLLLEGDVRPAPDMLHRLVAQALRDESGDVGAWEPRHLPLEQARYYDPVTGYTNWIAFGCALVRKDAFIAAGGLGAGRAGTARDVDLSYRMRRAGFLLQYCPEARVACPWVERRVSIGTYLSLWGRYHLPTGRRSHTTSPAPRLAYPLGGRSIDLNRTVCPTALPNACPKVSIIVRTYRGRTTFLKQALQSLIRQTYTNIQIVVVEDGGDHQQAHVQRMADIARGTGKEILYLSAEKVGRSATGNIGLQHASGDYMGFLDDDDLFFRDHVETLVAAVSAAETDAAYGLAWAIKTRKAGNANGYLETAVVRPKGYERAFTYALLETENIFPIQSILFRRALYDRHGGFDITLDQLEDWNLWLRYADGADFTLVRKTTSMFRVPDEDAVLQERRMLMEAARDTAKQKAAATLAMLRLQDE